MPRVKCPHCGAGNQDATEQDTCWDCGNVLGAPVARPQTPVRPPMYDAGAKTQQLDPSQINIPGGMNQPVGGPSQRTLAIFAVITVLMIGGLIVFLISMFGR